jgi:hypothetical protein
MRIVRLLGWFSGYSFKEGELRITPISFGLGKNYELRMGFLERELIVHFKRNFARRLAFFIASRVSEMGFVFGLGPSSPSASLSLRDLPFFELQITNYGLRIANGVFGTRINRSFETGIASLAWLFVRCAGFGTGIRCLTRPFEVFAARNLRDLPFFELRIINYKLLINTSRLGCGERLALERQIKF